MYIIFILIIQYKLINELSKLTELINICFDFDQVVV